MLIVKFNPNSTDSNTRYALQYSDKDFEELSKIWRGMNLELLVHKREVDPPIDIIDRDRFGYISCAKTIVKGDWFIYDRDWSCWDVCSGTSFHNLYNMIGEKPYEDNNVAGEEAFH